MRSLVLFHESRVMNQVISCFFVAGGRPRPRRGEGVRRAVHAELLQRAAVLREAATTSNTTHFASTDDCPASFLASGCGNSSWRRRRRRRRLLLQKPSRSPVVSNKRQFHSSPAGLFSAFDPMKSPLSASLLKRQQHESNDENDNDEGSSSATLLLSPEEIELKECLQAYQEQKQLVSSSGDVGVGVGVVDPDLLDQLHQAYMALEYWEEALQVEEMKCQDWLVEGTDEYADSMHNQGKLWLRQGDFDRSKPLYEQALEYFQRTGNRVQEGHALISLAGWYYFQHEQQLHQQQRHPSSSASSSSSSSSTQPPLETAMDCLQRAETLLDTNPTLLVKCLDNQGLICRLWGDFESALDKYEQALQVVVDDSTRRALQLHVADMLMALDDSPQALAVYQELLQECQQEQQQPQPQNPPAAAAAMQGILWHNIAHIHVQEGEYELAEHDFRQSLHWKQESSRTEDHPELAKTWNALGALYFGILDEKHQALECFRRVLWIARTHSDHADHSTDPEVLAALQTISDIEEQLDKER